MSVTLQFGGHQRAPTLDPVNKVFATLSGTLQLPRIPAKTINLPVSTPGTPPSPLHRIDRDVANSCEQRELGLWAVTGCLSLC